MGWVVLYFVLAAAFITSLFFPTSHHFSWADLVKDICGASASVGALAQALAKVHLRTYLLFQRVRIWWASDRTTHWRFALRLDGLISDEPLESIAENLVSSLGRWHPAILVNKPREMLLLIDRTLHLQISFVPSDESEDGESHLLISSHEVEVSYGAAGRKLDSAILPIMSAFTEMLRPSKSSSVFEVEFEKQNPFFSFFVAHLDASQVTNFNLVFQPKLSHGGYPEKVTVTATGIEIVAETNEAFSRLAKAFILLSSEAITLTQGS